MSAAACCVADRRARTAPTDEAGLGGAGTAERDLDVALDAGLDAARRRSVIERFVRAHDALEDDLEPPAVIDLRQPALAPEHAAR